LERHVTQDEIREWIEKSSRLLIKKLSRNDCSWADSAENGHQNGTYIPREIREAGFFPPLRNVNSEKPHIFESEVATLWPATGEIKLSNLKHYSNKGTEMHFTGVPKEEFTGLTPASLLIGGKLCAPIDGVQYWFMVIDSASAEAELLESNFDLAADFHYGLFDPVAALQIPRDETEQLIEELNASLNAGTLIAFIASVFQAPRSTRFGG